MQSKRKNIIVVFPVSHREEIQKIPGFTMAWNVTYEPTNEYEWGRIELNDKSIIIKFYALPEG